MQAQAVFLRTQSGYPCLSLHGGKDQSDRESTISDFKSNVCNVLVATSVAARGLDVKDLVCFAVSIVYRVVKHDISMWRLIAPLARPSSAQGSEYSRVPRV